MLTLTRSLVRQIRILFSRAVDLPLRLYGSCPVHVSAKSDGLTLRVQLGDYAAEYRHPGSQACTEFVTSPGLLKAIEGHKPDPISLETDARQCVIARWHEGQIPRVLSEDPPHVDPGAKFPDLPESWQNNPPGLWAALAAAQGTTDPNSSRYALGCIQLRGKGGVVAATDGSQLLRQRGFEFGWEEELLIRGLKLFASRELPLDQPVDIALHDKRVVLRSGGWTFWLPVQEGRFPRVDDVVPLPGQTRTTLCMPPAQQQFLKEQLPKLKCGGLNECVTLDLNGQIAVRTRENEAAPPTQLTLTRASYQGDALRLVTPRYHLQRALELGFQEVSFISPETVIVCREEKRDYVWMPVDPASAIASTPDTVEILSPGEINLVKRRPKRIEASSSVSPTSVPHITPMSQPTTPEQPVATRVSKVKAQPPAARANLIEQAVHLRTKLRELLVEMNELVRAAKRQKQQERLVRTTLASLKQLQVAS